MALGFVALGSSVGGTVLPIAARKLIETVGSVILFPDLVITPTYQSIQVSMGNENNRVHTSVQSQYFELGSSHFLRYRS
jgi:hypothetical protein